MTEVTVSIGAGAIGLAIARRVSAGRHVLVADLHQKHADAVANTLIEAGSRPAQPWSMSRRALRCARSPSKRNPSAPRCRWAPMGLLLPPAMS